MAIHQEKVELLKESLIEMMHVAQYTVSFRKIDKVMWGSNATGGILGYPAVVILFSIIDCLGSVFKGNREFLVPIDGKSMPIKETNQHIYILNSRYFDLDLGLIDLENIYKNVRSTLTHNSLLPAGYILQLGENETLPFNVAINELGKRIYFINVIKLYEFVQVAVRKFIRDLDTGNVLFKESLLHSTISRRDVPMSLYQQPNGQFQIPIKTWIKK